MKGACASGSLLCVTLNTQLLTSYPTALGTRGNHDNSTCGLPGQGLPV